MVVCLSSVCNNVRWANALNHKLGVGEQRSLASHCTLTTARFAFLGPPLGDLGATYDDRLRLIGKRVVDFLLALIELFSLSVTAEALRAIIG